MTRSAVWRETKEETLHPDKSGYKVYTLYFLITLKNLHYNGMLR